MSNSDFAVMDFDPSAIIRSRCNFSSHTEDKIYLNVPFEEKDEAKKFGARWDYNMKRWYYTDSNLTHLFDRWIVGDNRMTFSDLTDEQKRLIEEVRKGNDVLVDACIGSGKTTAVQILCNEMPDHKILYLTYNRLLKTDAKEKICQPNTDVNNYHGFAYQCLHSMGVESGVSDLIKSFLKNKPQIEEYDILILDEYQDIDREIADMLQYIKNQIPHIQIVAVGDMKQKIYDKTDLNVPEFITNFLENYISINFTKCFRISSNLADMLGRIWSKDINGVNKKCQIEIMDLSEAIRFLSKQKPSDILCLGAREGAMARALNVLEDEYSNVFNKKTVYASIRNRDDYSVSPGHNTAIFTTFDGAKGLERNICVVFDFTEEYWQSRISKPYTKYEILRNIFCVAASRGKEHIIFVRAEKESILTEETLSTHVPTELHQTYPLLISEMFDFKYKEDVEDCFDFLNIKPIKTSDTGLIDVKSHDNMIDLSPCIGIWQEAAFFKNYNIDSQIQYAMNHHPDRPRMDLSRVSTVEEKILALTSYETCQDRYMFQVEIPFITSDQKARIVRRLSSLFTGSEDVQGNCSVYFKGRMGSTYCFEGRYDVLLNNIVYELKFKNELQHEDFLQAACYSVALGLDKSIIWNVKTGDMFEITVSDTAAFLDNVVKTVTKRSVLNFVGCLSSF